MSFEVRVSDFVAEKIATSYGSGSGPEGEPSELNFWEGPLASALIGFQDFTVLGHKRYPKVRRLHIFDPMFGPIVFIGVLVELGVVEIADFEIDPDYWEAVRNDPDS